MPIEIKELKIKAIILPESSGALPAERERIPQAEIDRIKREIKRECIDEVKQFINDLKER